MKDIEETSSTILQDDSLNGFIMSTCSVERCINKYLEFGDVEAKKELRAYTKNKIKIKQKIINSLSIVIENNLEGNISTTYSDLILKHSYDSLQDYKKTHEFELFNKYLLVLPYMMEDLAEIFVINSILSLKDNVSYENVLCKSITVAEKYLEDIDRQFNLSSQSFNHLSFAIIKGVCTSTYQSLFVDKYSKFLEVYYEKQDEIQFVEKQLFDKSIIPNKSVTDVERLLIDSKQLKSELIEIENKFYNNIVGFNAISKLKTQDMQSLKFNFKEFKIFIQKLFSEKKEEESSQLKYVLWIMHLIANKKSDVLPCQDDFILNNIIIPWSQELRELVDEDFDNDNFDIEEAIKYIGRLRSEGDYKSLYYKTKVLKKIFNITDKPKDLSITEYKFRDTLTTDYSDRMNCILRVLKKTGTKATPALEEKNGFIVYKNGNALDDSDIELFWYLIGELEEHGCEQEIVFRKSDIVNNMGYKSLRGNKLDNLTSSLMNLNAQSIAIIDNRDDKVGKRLDKVNFKKFKGTQLLRADIIGEGDEVLIKFTSPFSKYFRQQKQFGRLLNREMINKYLYANTRVLKIARELSRMLFISNQKTKKSLDALEINYDTLIKNIDEWERYSAHSNQRVYLQRLSNDISKAISYMEDGIEYELIKPSPKTIKNGKIKIIK